MHGKIDYLDKTFLGTTDVDQLRFIERCRKVATASS